MKLEYGVSFRVVEIKNQKKLKTWILVVFRPPKGAFGSNFQKDIFFVITEYRLNGLGRKNHEF